MQFSRFSAVFLLVLVVLCSARTELVSAAEATSFGLGEGNQITLTAPAGWKKVKPKSGIIEHEFAVEPAKGDKEAGRVTVMGAGGSVDDNIKRWIGQFSQPDGSNTKDKAKIDKKTISGMDVRTADISGTYKDTPGGPFAGGKTVERPDYRMLAAIIVTPKSGNYFVKFYGPAKTVAENEKAFKELIDSLKSK